MRPGTQAETYGTERPPNLPPVEGSVSTICPLLCSSNDLKSSRISLHWHAQLLYKYILGICPENTCPSMKKKTKKVP